MKRLLEETGLDQPTELERMLLESIVLDVPPEGATAALMDRLDAPVAPIGRAKSWKRSTWLLLLAATIGVVVLLVRRHEENVPIVHEDLTAPAPSPSPVSSDLPAMQVPLPPAPPAATSASTPAPMVTMSAVRRPPSVPAAPSPALSTLLREATRDAGARSQEFDRGAAANALGHVDISECKQYRGPDGAGHLVAVFANDGHAQNVSVDPPFAGTERGACVAAKYATVRVPPFEGAPVRVGKSFVIN